MIKERLKAGKRQIGSKFQPKVLDKKTEEGAEGSQEQGNIVSKWHVFLKLF